MKKHIVCPRCGNIDGWCFVQSRKRYDCSTCRYSLFPLGGTIFHKSRTPLTKWFEVIYLLSLEDVSAKELQRRMKVTYKTAYRMKQQIALLGKGTFKEMIARAVKPVSRVYEPEIL